MAVHTHAHQGARPGPGRKAVKRMDERLRRDQRELERELRERAGRGCYPVRDEGAPPRID
ncbi:hypothetical protein D3C71_1072130 [compost metagenome]